MTQPTTSGDCLKAGWAALLKGDTAERDRMVARARTLMAAEDHAARVERVLSVDFYVTARGTAVPTKTMAQAAGELN